MECRFLVRKERSDDLQDAEFPQAGIDPAARFQFAFAADAFAHQNLRQRGGVAPFARFAVTVGMETADEDVEFFEIVQELELHPVAQTDPSSCLSGG